MIAELPCNYTEPGLQAGLRFFLAIRFERRSRYNRYMNDLSQCFYLEAVLDPKYPPENQAKLLLYKQDLVTLGPQFS